MTPALILTSLAPALCALAAIFGWKSARAWAIDPEPDLSANPRSDLPRLAWLLPFLVAGVLATGGAASLLRGLDLAIGYGLALVLLYAAAFDARSRILPDWGALALGAGGAALSIERAGATGLAAALAAGALAGALLFLIERALRFLIARQALGLGDVKYAAAGGVLLGPVDIWTALGLAALATLVFLAVSALIHRRPIERGPVAFGPALLGAIYLVFLARAAAPLLAV